MALSYHLEETHIVTREEAHLLVAKSIKERAKWCLSVRLDARVEGKPNREYRDGLSSYIGLSRQQASRLITNLISDSLEASGGRITIRKLQYAENSKITYWITQ